LTMPRLGGSETLAVVRAIRPGIPVVLASGYDEARVMAGDHPERPQAFLGEPYEFEELSDAIFRALVNVNIFRT
jgi:two-component system cell cycle sensor histidine kinase/response regulator CckA